MHAYLIAKWLHVLSSTVLFGTGLGSAFFMYFISRSRDPAVIAPVARQVVIADWVFTTPAVIVQPATGLWLAHLAGFPLASGWIAWSIALYLLAGAAWLPVVWLQIRMRDLAAAAARTGAALPEAYGTCLRAWVALGVVAFGALLVVFYLMVAKPSGVAFALPGFRPAHPPHCTVTVNVTVPDAPEASGPVSVHIKLPAAPTAGCVVSAQPESPAPSAPQAPLAYTVYAGVWS
jgi:uncharacterized membrane protein